MTNVNKWHSKCPIDQVFCHENNQSYFYHLRPSDKEIIYSGFFHFQGLNFDSLTEKRSSDKIKLADTAIKSKQLGSPLVETDYDHVHVRGKHSTQNYELLKQSQIVFCSQDKFVASSFNQYNCETSCCVIVVFFVNLLDA